MTQIARARPNRSRRRQRATKARQTTPKPPANGVAAKAVGQYRARGGIRPEQVLAVQRMAGNGAVTRMLAQPVAELAADGLLQCSDPAAAEGESTEPGGKLAIPTVIGYIGMNPDAVKEAKTLKRVSKDQVLISLDDPKAHKKMNSDEGLAQFIYKELGLHPLYDLFKFIEIFSYMKSVDFWGREQVGHMLKWFSAAEAGKHKLERLVLSGHSDGVDLWGESENEKDEPGSIMVYRDLATMAEIYPKAAAQVQDIMFSACWSVMAIQKMAEIFPNLQTAWGYIGFSPSVKQGSAKHIRKWEMTTRGERTPKKRDRRGVASIWTRDEGYIAGSPADYDLGELKEEFNGMSDRVGQMFSGDADLNGDFLRDIYFTMQLISIHPEAEAKTVDDVREMLEITLRLRYWDKITREFAKAHGAAIEKAYKGFSIAKPRFYGIKRPALKTHMDAYQEALAKKEHAAAREFMDDLLRPGLWQLDSNIIPDTWI